MDAAHWLERVRLKGGPDEYDAKQLLRQYGIEVPGGVRLSPGQNPGQAVKSISPPYAVKVCEPDILHKTDKKGVWLNVGEQRLEETLRDGRRRFPGRHFLVEHFTGFTGPEFIIGLVRDPALGHAVMVGAGGVFTEIYDDVAFSLVPCDRRRALEMIEELTLAPVFEGFRGMAPDKRGLSGAVTAVSGLALDLKDGVSQLDINPIVYGDGRWIALDARIIIGPPSCAVP